MDFRLTYEGPLQHDGGADHKHEIRKVFYEQLKRLWEIQPIIKHWQRPRTAGGTEKDGVLTPSEKSRLEELATRLTTC